MLVGTDLKRLNAKSKDDTIAIAYGALPQVRELILSFPEIDPETYEQLYQFAKTSLEGALSSVFYYGFGLGKTTGYVLDLDGDVNYNDFFYSLFDDFASFGIYVNAGAFAPYLQDKNDDGCDEARVQAWWNGVAEGYDSTDQEYGDPAYYFFRTWDIDWDEFREAMLHDEKKSKIFLEKLATIPYMKTYPRAFFRFQINDKVYLIFTYSIAG